MLKYLIGHRGASGYEPENTLRSFRRAFRDGANAIECDLRLSRDGHVVVIHDGRVDRTTDGSGSVEEMSVDELRKLDAGAGECIPSLAEVLGLVKENEGIAFLELKARGMATLVVSGLVSSGMLGRAVIFGPPKEVLEHRRIEPSIQSTAPGRFRIGIGDLSPAGISRMHAQGLELIHGDTDDEDEMQRLIDLGVDGIITNYPNRLANVAGAES